MSHNGTRLQGFSAGTEFVYAGHQCLLNPACAAVVIESFVGAHHTVLRYWLHGEGALVPHVGADTVLRTEAASCTPPSPPPPPTPPSPPRPPPPPPVCDMLTCRAP